MEHVQGFMSLTAATTLANEQVKPADELCRVCAGHVILPTARSWPVGRR